MAVANVTTASAVATSGATEATIVTVASEREATPGSPATGAAVAGVRVQGLLVGTVPGSATAAVVRVRAGSLVGTAVGTITYAVTASTTGVPLPFDFLDTTNAPGSTDYFVTVSYTSGSGAGAISVATVSASVVAVSQT